MENVMIRLAINLKVLVRRRLKYSIGLRRPNRADFGWCVVESEC